MENKIDINEYLGVKGALGTCQERQEALTQLVTLKSQIWKILLCFLRSDPTSLCLISPLWRCHQKKVRFVPFRLFQRPQIPFFLTGQPCPYLWVVAGFEEAVDGVTGVLLPGVVDQPTGFDGLLFQGLVFINHVFIPVRGSQGLDEELLATGLKIATKKWGGMRGFGSRERLSQACRPLEYCSSLRQHFRSRNSFIIAESIGRFGWSMKSLTAI